MEVLHMRKHLIYYCNGDGGEWSIDKIPRENKDNSVEEQKTNQK